MLCQNESLAESYVTINYRKCVMHDNIIYPSSIMCNDFLYTYIYIYVRIYFIYIHMSINLSKTDL